MTEQSVSSEETKAFNPHDNTTIDGVVITEGMVVWDYNLRLSVVTDDPHCSDWCDGDHWFTCTGGYFNGDRMWVAHPRTRQLARDAYSGSRG